MSNEGSQEIDTSGTSTTAPLQDSPESGEKDEGTVSTETQETEKKVEGEGEVKLTEKGTKLDPDPKSAVHQNLANANRRIQQMERVLGSPELLRKFAKESGMSLTEAKAEIKEAKDEVEDFTGENFQTAEDVASVLNQMRSGLTGELQSLKDENKRLMEGMKGMDSSRQAEKVANTMQQDITTIRGKYPELDPKSSEYDKDLEKEIGLLYHDLDFDPQSKSYRGSVSMASLADRVMKAAGRAKKKGSEQAQTDVVTKQAGKVVTPGKSPSKGTTESKDPGTAIAQKIAKTLGN